MGDVFKAVTSIFTGTPSVPKAEMPPPPPPAPSIDNTAVQAAADEERRLRSGKGRASTILTSGTPEDQTDPSLKKTLYLGS